MGVFLPEARVAGDPQSLFVSLLDIARLQCATEDLRAPANHLLAIAFALTGLEEGCVYIYERDEGILAPLAWRPEPAAPAPGAIALDGGGLVLPESRAGGTPPRGGRTPGQGRTGAAPAQLGRAHQAEAWDGLVVQVAMTGQPYYESAVAGRVREEPAPAEGQPGAALRRGGDGGTRAYSGIILPLVARGYVVGVLSLRAGDPTCLSAATLGLLNLAASQIAAVIEGARLYEAAVRERAKARAIVDCCAEGIMVVDASHRIVDVNPALLGLTGFAADELLGQVCTYRLNARDLEGRSICDVYCPLREGARVLSGEVEATALTRDGREVWIGVTYGRLKDATGKTVGVVHTIRDISAQKAAERMKDNFLAAASHELRTPITSIRGYAQMLDRRLSRREGRDEDVKALRVIIRQVDRLIELVNQLLDVSRIQKGEFDLVLSEFDIVALASKVVEEVAAVADGHQLSVHAASPVRVLADANRIEQVLTSLLANAVAYSPGGGQVNVRVQAVEDHAVVVVEDQGIGIPPDRIKLVFERFYRAHVDPPYCFGGIGLGLYLSRSIVARHGGKMWVESREDEGSKFYFSLPLARRGAPGDGG